MRDSVTYQAIVEEGEARGRVEGRVEGDREMLTELAARRLGAPSPEAMRWLASISSAERLIALGIRLFEVESWDELMAS